MITHDARRTVNILLVDDEQDAQIVLQLTLKKVKSHSINLKYVGDIRAAVDCIKADDIDIVLLDNRLIPNNDFRETAPQLRKAGYLGPIGIVSSDISDSYFQEFEGYGADFRIGKDELDGAAISFIISEYARDPLSAECAEDFG